MANITQYLADKLLDHANGKISYSMPTEVYIGMLKTASTSSTPGTEVTTSDVTSYARIAVPPADIAAASAGATSNSTFVAGATAGAGGTSPSVGFWGAYDAITGGNQLWFGSLTLSFTYAPTIQPQVPIGNLTMSIL